jgi:hypothetical protein
MSNESYPQSNPHPPAHDVDSGCASDPTPPPAACEPTSPSGPPAEAPGSDIGLNLDFLPKIDASADVDALGTGVSANLSTDTSSGTGDDASGGIDIDLAVTTPDLGGGGGEVGHPLVSLDSETDAVINVPAFGENGIVGGSHDFGSLLTAAMLDVGGHGGLGAIIGSDAYDGNVPLASDLSSALGSTLDLLTTTSSLFDVPTLDILGCDGLDG